MTYGPGMSVKLWHDYFPHVTLHEAEVNSECAQKYANVLPGRIHTGNQASPRCVCCMCVCRVCVCVLLLLLLFFNASRVGGRATAHTDLRIATRW